MTGERPQDDDVVEPNTDDTVEIELEDDDDQLDAAETEFVEDVAPEPAPVVSQEEAAAVVAAETSRRKTVDDKGRPVPDDELPYIDDRASKIWVGLIAAVFIGILVWGLLGGKGGFLSPQPTPEPTPSPAPSLTAAPSPSATPRPTTSGSPAASPSAAPSGTPEPTVAPSVAPSPS